MARSTTERAARGRPGALAYDQSYYFSTADVLDSWDACNLPQAISCPTVIVLVPVPVLVLTLTTVKHASTPHHVPYLVGIARVLTNDESLKVLLDEPTSGGPTETGRIPDRTVRRGELYKDGTEHADTP